MYTFLTSIRPTIFHSSGSFLSFPFPKYCILKYMDTEYDRSRIEQAKRSLYSSEEETREAFSRLSPHEEKLEDTWGDHIADRAEAGRSRGVRILKWTVLFAAVIMVGSLGYLLYSVYDPFAKPSDKNISFTLDFPVAIASGGVSPIKITVDNANKVPLEDAKLTIFYPQGTKKAGDNSSDFLKDHGDLGAVGARSSGSYASEIMIFGEENTDKQIHVVLEYRFKGLNSVFTKEETWPVSLISSPVNMTVKSLKEVNAGGPVEFTVTVSSNATTPLEDMLLRAQYPQGFTFESADPKPTYGIDGWKIRSLDPSGKVTVRIRGSLVGESTQEKAFSMTVGEPSDRDERTVATVYATHLSLVSVQKPFIGVNLIFNDRAVGDSAFVFGKNVTAGIEWVNNLPYGIADVEIEVRLGGTALDRYSVSPDRTGYYRSVDNAIVWDKRLNPNLALVDSSGRGMISFNFSSLPSVSNGKPLKNPTIVVDVTIRGHRISESGVPEEVKSVSTKTVKIISDVRLSGKTFYFTGPLVNRGPLPPRVDQETTYTVGWSIVNASNDLDDVEVRGTLPPGVTWDGSISPAGQNVIFDRNINQVIWRPGHIDAGEGILTAPRELFFQVALTPSISQIKQMPSLVVDTELIGRDAFAGAPVSRKIPAITTNVSSGDPKGTREQGSVVP